MRTTISIYRQLHTFLEESDAAYAASLSASSPTPTSASVSSSTTPTPSNASSTPASYASTPATTPGTTASADFTTLASRKQKPIEDPSIDPHLRSGIYLGAGMCNIILSLMPGKLATFVELFGYRGDRKAGLDLLVRAGGWDVDQEEPNIGTGVCPHPLPLRKN